MAVFVWRDPSPVDGCALVTFTVQAASLDEVARLAREVPWSRCRTAKKLREIGWARRVDDASLPSSTQPAIIFWESEDGWRPAL